MAQQRRHAPRRRRRRGQFAGLYRLLGALVVLAAVSAACVVFFRVNEVTVTGNVRYNAQDVVEASGIQTGDNLMTMAKGRVAAAIRDKLPYVESVSIRRYLPDRVEITVRERVAAAQVGSGTGSWLISSQGKILEQAGTYTAMRIVGLTAMDPVVGNKLQVKEADQPTLGYVLDLLSALDEEGMLKDCYNLDCTGLTSIELEWSIYKVVFPRGGDYSYMVALLKKAAASSQMPQDQPGTFDLTIEDGAIHFKKQK